MHRILPVLGLGLALATPALAAEPTLRWSAEQLQAMARADGGQLDCLEPPARVAEAEGKLLVFAPEQVADVLRLRVPVPADGYYAIEGRVLLGPGGAGRLGPFDLVAGGARLRGFVRTHIVPAHGPLLKPHYRIIRQPFGGVHLSAPCVELVFRSKQWGWGQLLAIQDLALVPLRDDQVRDDDRDRRAAPCAEPSRTGPDGPRQPQLTVQRVRGSEWTTFVPPAPDGIDVDGRLDDWRDEHFTIRLDADAVPARGWASPVPENDRDLSASVAVAWDREHLYLAAKVRDDRAQAKTDETRWGSPWGHDGLVLQVHPPGWLTGTSRGTDATANVLMLGLNYHSPGAAPRGLPGTARYRAAPRPDGYALEAAIPFAVLGWTPAQAGDRFPFALILVDRDPDKPGGRDFTQYGWNFGPASPLGTGEARLMGKDSPAEGDLIPAVDPIQPGRPLPVVGALDLRRPATLAAVELHDTATGRRIASFPASQELTQPGRYRVLGELPLPRLEPGRYELRLRWE